MTDDDREWERIKTMSADDIRKECQARGIDTSKTVGVVLELKVIATKNINGAWFWRIVGGNGEIMANSEAYSSKSACTKSAKIVAVAGGFEFQVED